MRRLRQLGLFCLAGVLALTATRVRTAVAAPSSVSMLVGIRAAHHPTSDRVVFDFVGGVPSDWHQARHGIDGYPTALVTSPAGRPAEPLGD